MNFEVFFLFKYVFIPLQHALRLIAFRQIHKVLGMDPLPPPKFTRGRFNRKRRRDNSSGEGNDSEGKHIVYTVILCVPVCYTYLKLL